MFGNSDHGCARICGLGEISPRKMRVIASDSELAFLATNHLRSEFMRYLTLVLALSACTPSAPVEIPIGILPVEDACGASSLQDLVGQGAGALAAMTFDTTTTRFITEGDMITMDFSAQRLNIESDASGTITRVFCG
jgi:hypothetical protein